MIGSILFTGLISFISICSIQTNRHQTNDNSDKPNILIIMADDCTYNDLALYGGVNVETPEIDYIIYFVFTLVVIISAEKSKIINID